MGIEGLYDCVITNIPFSQNIDLNTSAYYYDGLAKKSGDGVCMLHCFKSVRKGGRMALIVPEGVLFKKTLSPIRKFLLENARLETVISLPQGVFLPYTGVKTSILYFTGCHESNSKEGVRFYEVKNDGFSLNNRRRPIELNDLKYIDYVDFSKSLHTDVPLTTNSLGESLGFQKVEYEDIKQNDYNLIFNRYSPQACVARLHSVGKKGCEYITLSKLIQEAKIKNDINAPVYSITNNNGFIKTEERFKERVASKNTESYKLVLPSMFAYNPARVNVGSIALNKSINTVCVSPMYVTFKIENRENLDLQYLNFVLKSKKVNLQIRSYASGSIRQIVSFNDFCKIQIPLPPLETQQKIVEELDNIQKGINCLNEAIDSLKKQVNLDSVRFEHYFDGDV